MRTIFKIEHFISAPYEILNDMLSSLVAHQTKNRCDKHKAASPYTYNQRYKENVCGEGKTGRRRRHQTSMSNKLQNTRTHCIDSSHTQFVRNSDGVRCLSCIRSARLNANRERTRKETYQKGACVCVAVLLNISTIVSHSVDWMQTYHFNSCSGLNWSLGTITQS